MALRDKLLPGTKPGFLKSEKMFRFKLLYIHKSVSENVYANNILIYGGCYSILLTCIIKLAITSAKTESLQAITSASVAITSATKTLAITSAKNKTNKKW